MKNNPDITSRLTDRHPRTTAEDDTFSDPKSGLSSNRTTPFKDNLFNFVDTNLRWIRYGVYGMGVVGVVLIIRASRSTHIFRQISDIPESYITRNLTLQGSVENVGPDCSLYVKHKPILSVLPWRTGTTEGTLLPVHLAAIEGSPAGRKWLLDEVKGQHVWFRLLERTDAPPRLDCLVKVKKGVFFRTDISEELIRLGLCRLKDFPTLPRSPRYNHVIDRLVAIEAREERKRTSRIRRVASSIKYLFVSVTPFPKQLKAFVSKFRRK